ncbi:hypothetical protein EVAR_101094_1 [Eumeta japonica]|uniref:HAT C-terminal dimerisation domain-containing protein n=1 Tax=Eumeta variegata TaxID=151549 RepID=A0A4C1SHB7_EUMVA|nr:hypothetical protein EVAR_101094_1 [Eumeta japonica]
MPKPQYTQHFRDSWLQDPHLKDWLQVIESTAGQVAKCKFCGTTLRSHYGDLKSHGIKEASTKQKVIIMQPKIPFKPEPTGSKKEARLALFTAMHTSIRVVDHLGEEEVPHLILVRCLCHSLQLAVSAAAKEFLPRNLEFLIRETYDWFSRSSSRQSLYKELYKTINDGQKPLKIVQACQTSVEQALNHNKQPLIDIIVQFNKSAEHIARVDDQWHQIHLLKWNETNNTKKFWNEVLHFKDAQGNSRFDELATFAITLLILPHSNADVERLFSSMNIIKNKQRNRMTLKLLTAILRVRCGLRLEGKCCNNYEVPVSVVKQIGTKESYQSDTDDDGADKTDSSEDELI